MRCDTHWQVQGPIHTGLREGIICEYDIGLLAQHQLGHPMTRADALSREHTEEHFAAIGPE